MPKCALIADDDALVLAVVTEFLEELGFQTYCARNGCEAIDFLQSPCTVDLVVTDVQMPEATGLDVFVAARLRCACMPVVYISGYIPQALRKDITRDAHAEIVDKPFDVDSLAAAIGSVMA